MEIKEIIMKKSIPSKLEIEDNLKLNSGSLNKTKIYFDVCYQTLYKWLDFYNIPFTKKAPGGKGNISTTNTSNTKEYWLELVKKYKSRSEIAKFLNVTESVPHYWLTFHNIVLDGRNVAQNKLNIPSREELENLYITESLLGISKHYGNVSNVTVKKWFIHHNIPIRSHKNNQKLISYPKSKMTNLNRYGTEYLLPPTHSKAELEILEWLNSEGFNFKSNRSILLDNYELDGYDPNINAAFEYCGLWWHSERFKDDHQCHKSKYVQCLKQGIKLFTIYENEWKDKKNQVKGFLLGSLGKYDIKLHARECIIKIVDKHDNRIFDFFDEFHIQGSPNQYDFCVLLMKDDLIIGGMSFGQHHRQNHKNLLVLNRLCWRAGYMVTGGSKRMFSYMPAGKTIVSWSDNRYTTGSVYDKLGFKLDTEYPVDYSYTNNQGKLKSKQSMQKRLIDPLPGQTEKERCLDLGFYRIWDCGKKKWSIST